MPMYDYRCRACSKDFEMLVRASDTPACPHCASTALERQLSRTVAPGTSGATIAAGRRLAAREGHFSHYSAAERSKIN